MKFNWTTKKLSEIAYINPRESIGKGVVAKKVPMDRLQPFCRDIPEFVLEEYNGGTKFKNDDTIMARITPCLENGKIVDALDDKEYTGSLVTLLQAGTDFVRNNSKKAWRKVGDGRIEMPDYPDRAVLEGVVNALIHRNYLEIGSEVHIDMFDDRIEIYSPGGMVSGISLEGKNLLKIPSKRRNPILADIFSRLKYMERRGNGFKKILADYEGQVEFDETKMPVFDADNDDFTLTLYNLNYGTNYATHVNENVIENVIEISEEKMKQLMPEYSKKKLTKACEILKMISENPNISIDELRIALDVTDRTIARYISELKDKGIIERKGPDNGGKWEIR